MKLLRYGPKGKEKPGVLDRHGNLRDLSGMVSDITPDKLVPAAFDRLRKLDPASLPPVTGEQRLGVPIANIGKLVCIGLNYHDHAKETGNPIPSEPVIFMKATSSLTRSERRRDPTQGRDQGRLGGRARHSHRRDGQIRRRARRAQACRRLLHRQRRLGARFPDGARRAMDEGQKL